MEDNEPERVVESLADQADSLGDQITETREDWERKKADPAVPGADGDPLAAHSDNPETAYPAKGDSESLGGDLEADEPLDPSEPSNEDL